MKTEILLKVSKIDHLAELYGMGSYFKGDTHRDVDLVAIVDCHPSKMLQVADEIRAACNAIYWGSECPVDVTILTEGELIQRPLRDIDTMVSLYRRSNDAAVKPIIL